MFVVPPTETLVETRKCRHCSADFPITDKDLEFYEKISPVFAGKKYAIPAPTFCPDCRLQRRLSWRNERKLYKRDCDATGKTIVSIYSPDKPLKVYHQDFWWSDKWDPLSYGRDFNFARPFFEQFDELFREVPHQNIWGVNNTNSEYSNFLMNSKDCYLTISGRDNTRCLYGRNVRDCDASVDVLQVAECSDVYDVIVAARCHNVLHSMHVFDSRDSEYLFFCNGCENCFACANLTTKQYHYFNESLSPAEYARRVEDFKKQPEELQKRLVREHAIKFPRRHLHAFENEDFSGIDYVRNSKSVKQSLFLAECENAAFCFEQEKSSDIFDCSIGGNGNQHCYEGLAIGLNAYNDRFFIHASANAESSYFDSCFNSSHLFGCIGLRNKQYCVFNRQYTKEEYETLVPRIIEHMRGTGEWGEFFPSSISPFGYNETVAQEYYPMTREEALGKNFVWSGYEPPFPKVEKTIPASKLPENIEDVPDDILNWAIECEVTGKPFRIIKQELEFYRKHGIPVPRRHPDQRHLDRMALRNPRKLFERTCDCPDCAKNNAAPDGKPAKFLTTYSPERPEKVYCEKCYAKEVAG